MKSEIVADGPIRLLRGHREKIRKSIEAKYAAQMPAANFAEKWKRRTRMALELFQTEAALKKHLPSAGTLW